MERSTKRNRYTIRIRPRQLETLVSYMEKHPELAIGKICEDLPSEKKEAMWKELVEKLNGVFGGPRKTYDQWRKTWVDQKGKAQAKALRLIRNGENLAAKLTPIEERILGLVGMKENPSGSSLYVPDAEAISLPVIRTEEMHPAPYEDCLDVILSESSDMSSSTQSPILPDTVLETAMLTDAVPEENLTVTPDLNVASTSNCVVTIKQEPIDEEILEETSISKSPLTITSSDMPTSPVEKSSRKRIRNRSKYRTAEKVAETFVNIAEKNCSVLERLATALEDQAEETAKHTLLMREMITAFKNR